MTVIPLRGTPAPDPETDLIARAIAAAGPGRVLRAAVLAMLSRRARPPDAAALPPRLRRDVGLQDTAPPLPSERSDPFAHLGPGQPTLPGQTLR
ncbi:hypothetical protein [Jannaschia sp. LMIT008]|uniref:hypothetical protein n=1 Tax=Jannaschia maritima TaxID=3032585 RepID=UPI002810DD9B|nr:hypothetical protein [Jannaschia sp. LMIT008]